MNSLDDLIPLSAWITTVDGSTTRKQNSMAKDDFEKMAQWNELWNSAYFCYFWWHSRKYGGFIFVLWPFSDGFLLKIFFL